MQRRKICTTTMMIIFATAESVDYAWLIQLAIMTLTVDAHIAMVVGALSARSSYERISRQVSRLP